MARRQIEIPGTERADVPPVIIEAGEKWLDQRRTRRVAIDKAKEGKAAIIALMEMHKLPSFTLKDPDTDEYIELEIKTKTTLSSKKRNEVDGEIGDGVPESGEPPARGSGPGIPQGLIDSAMQAQAEANVEENADGDVQVPETAAPKAKKKRKAKAVGGKNKKARKS